MKWTTLELSTTPSTGHLQSSLYEDKQGVEMFQVDEVEKKNGLWLDGLELSCIYLDLALNGVLERVLIIYIHVQLGSL